MTQILATKLFAPEVRDSYIMRKALIEKIRNGISLDNKLTLVSAPAGYGKTTLILELLKSIDHISTWISLDEGDNDLIQFLAYLIAALRKTGIMIDINTENIASDINLSLTNAPITMIINQIASFSSKVVLVLDDFHFINSSQVYEVVKFLLEHQPSNFHLIIITREDPQLPLPKLRVQRRITEIRMEDLRFSNEEAREFFLKGMKLDLGSVDLNMVNSRTEGWIAGLQLAGITLSNCESDGIEQFVKEFSGTHRYIIDYLVDEVLSNQEEEVREFLCKTSILERMNGELCNAVTGEADSRHLLQELEKSNLFLIPLDSKRDWYRYHHLFADSVRTELTKSEEQQLNGRAAQWLEANGNKSEAIKYAYKSGDFLLVRRLIEDCTEDSFRNAQLTTLLKWMSMLPEELIKNSEILSVRKAWALFITKNADEAVDYVASLGEDFYASTTPQNKGLLLSLRANFAQFAGLDTDEALAEEAMKYLEPWDPIARISTMNTLGKAQKRRGRIGQAFKTFSMAYNDGLKLGYTFITTLALLNLGNCLNSMGQRKDAIKLLNEYTDGMSKEFGRPLPYIGIIYVGLAGFYYEEHELSKAKYYIEKGIELCESISYNWALNNKELAARIRQEAESGTETDIEMPTKKTEFTYKEETDVRAVIIRGAEVKNEAEAVTHPTLLTQREKEILELLGKGLSNIDISKKLYITTNTTQWHISHILSKLDAKSRTQAVLKAKESGIL